MPIRPAAFVWAGSNYAERRRMGKKNALTFCKNFKGVFAQRSGGRENLRKKLWRMPKKPTKKESIHKINQWYLH